VQGWRTVYTWAAALLAEAVTAGRMEDRLGPAASIHAMLLEIRNAGGRIFTMIGSQLPYTYVHLVSFVCHIFLVVLATYFGFALNSGIPPTHYDLVVKGASVGQVFSARSGGRFNPATDTTISDDWWLFRLQIYLFIVFSNALVQGLLSMHALLENPFGQHPGKFPLRAYAIDHIRQTRAMLKDSSEREPEMMRDIFKSAPPARSVTARTGDLSALSAATDRGRAVVAAAAAAGDAVAVPVGEWSEKAPLLDEDTGGSML
jgi:hypothetical protein